MNNSGTYLQLSQSFINLWQSGVKEFEAFTSGSTGTPKRILLPRRLMEESAMRSIRHFGLDESSTIHLILSPEYIAGKMCIVRALISESHLTIEEPSSHPLTASTTPAEITLLSAVGAQLQGMIALKEQNKLPHIKHLLLGGGPLTAEMRSQAITLANNVWESYGMTETASHIALRRVALEPGHFFTLPGISVSTDTRGCLVIKMPTIGILTTNDLAKIYPDGSFIILGRADNALISGGLKVIPERVEQTLSQHLPGRTFYITSQPHTKWGEQIILVLEEPHLSEPKSINAKEFDIAGVSLYTLCHSLLKPHECPAIAILTPHIPRTDSGKIIRNKMTN
ncbi:MAG: AMP-binding protein [Muribaculaceae bacterium]|nr:AMP-binding protein [Muribaculaceae bacterium]